MSSFVYHFVRVVRLHTLVLQVFVQTLRYSCPCDCGVLCVPAIHDDHFCFDGKKFSNRSVTTNKKYFFNVPEVSNYTR